jgi:predicted nucleotidyltransferase
MHLCGFGISLKLPLARLWIYTEELSEISNSPMCPAGIRRRRKIVKREEIFERIAQALKEQGARKIAVFGSYASGEEKPGSDIDVLVEFPERKSLLELVRIERELSEDLGIKVDLLTEKSISPYLIDTIREQMEVIYG